MIGYVIICTFGDKSTIYKHKVYKDENEAVADLNEYNEKLESDLDMTFCNRSILLKIEKYLKETNNISDSELYRNRMCRLSKDFEQKRKEYLDMGKCLLTDIQFITSHRFLRGYGPEQFENDEYCEFLMAERANPARIVKVDY